MQKAMVRCGARALAIVAIGATFTAASTAGPPLINDDPNTIGRGRVEAILAVRGGEELRLVSLSAPVLDLTVGLAEGLDAVFVAESFHIDERFNVWDHDGNFEGGVKWRPIATDRVVASFTPVVGTNVRTASEVFFLFPFQVEFPLGDFAVGFDAGYALVLDADDGWGAGIYGTWQAHDRLALMAELRSEKDSVIKSVDVAVNAGLELQLGRGFSLLASGGGGIYASNDNRVDWLAYGGIKWAFRLFGDEPDVATARRRDDSMVRRGRSLAPVAERRLLARRR